MKRATKVRARNPLPVVPLSKVSTPLFVTPRVALFVTREEFARRAPQTATVKENAQAPRPRPSADLRLFFTSVTDGREPHPLWRIFRALSRLCSGFFRVVRPVISVYLLVVTTITVPLALVAGLWWLAAYCAFIGMAFARLVLEDVRRWRTARALAGRMLVEDKLRAGRRTPAV